MYNINLNQVIEQIGISDEQLSFFITQNLIPIQMKQEIPYTTEEGLSYILEHVNLAGQLITICSSCSNKITSYKVTDENKVLCNECASSKNHKITMSLDSGIGITQTSYIPPTV